MATGLTGFREIMLAHTASDVDAIAKKNPGLGDDLKAGRDAVNGLVSDASPKVEKEQTLRSGYKPGG